MPVDIDYSKVPELPEKLPEKLKQIRGDRDSRQRNLRRTSVLMGYWKLRDVPLRNFLDDDRDLWFGQLREV